MSKTNRDATKPNILASTFSTLFCDLIKLCLDDYILRSQDHDKINSLFAFIPTS